jgi:dihydrofolate synthase/folylpolyglutamate synthase
MMETKDAHAFIAPFRGLVERVYTVPIPEEVNAFSAGLAEIAASEGFDVTPTSGVAALMQSRRPRAPRTLLICGSLYLAGNVLKLHGS